MIGRICQACILTILIAPFPAVAGELDTIAESYVRLVLAVGEHDSNYVDFYIGPEQWRAQARQEKFSLAELHDAASALMTKLENEDISGFVGDEKIRWNHLFGQIGSLIVFTELRLGKARRFDSEAASLYDAHVPQYPKADFVKALVEIGKMLPGRAPLVTRVDQFRQQFVIPPDRLARVFDAAVDECRRRTKKFMSLPSNEGFTVEYVTDKPWSGYNWYQGNNQSRVQINTDLPVYIERAVDLGCHEGYPGHHVYYLLLDTELVKNRGWIEFSVYALNSPQSLIAEGSANFGKSIAFPGNERLEFERDVLYPLAGLDPDLAEKYERLLDLLDRLRNADIATARDYRDGVITASEAAEQIVYYRLYTPERAAQRVRFFDAYGAYVINYTLGEDIVSDWVDRHAGSDDPRRRWAAFSNLLAVPRLPSDLVD